MPYTPQKLAGMRIDPPPSLPVAIGHRYAATAAAAPPLEPPGVRSSVPRVPPRLAQPVLAGANHPLAPVRSSFPRMIAPAPLTRSTTAASRSGTLSLNSSDPMVVLIPAVFDVSLIGMGQTVQRAQLVSPDHGGLRLRCGLHSGVPGQQQVRVQLRVEPVDALRSRARSARRARSAPPRSAPPSSVAEQYASSSLAIVTPRFTATRPQVNPLGAEAP